MTKKILTTVAVFGFILLPSLSASADTYIGCGVFNPMCDAPTK